MRRSDDFGPPILREEPRLQMCHSSIMGEEAGDKDKNNNASYGRPHADPHHYQHYCGSSDHDTTWSLCTLLSFNQLQILTTRVAYS
jgi:hypothetical protein